MQTNKYMATRKTKSGNTIEVTVERGTWNEKVTSDGWDTGITKTHIVDSKRIVFRNKAGKALASGDNVSEINPMFYSNYDEMIAKGAVARVGDAFIGQDTLDLINDALAEADEGAPKTGQQVDIETAQVEQRAKAEVWANSPRGKAEAEDRERYEQFKREMERPDSDY
jgi:hypothetical protein